MKIYRYYISDARLNALKRQILSIIVTAVISLIVAVATFYGLNVGVPMVGDGGDEIGVRAVGAGGAGYRCGAGSAPCLTALGGRSIMLYSDPLGITRTIWLDGATGQIHARLFTSSVPVTRSVPIPLSSALVYSGTTLAVPLPPRNPALGFNDDGMVWLTYLHGAWRTLFPFGIPLGSYVGVRICYEANSGDAMLWLSIGAIDNYGNVAVGDELEYAVTEGEYGCVDRSPPLPSATLAPHGYPVTFIIRVWLSDPYGSFTLHGVQLLYRE